MRQVTSGTPQVPLVRAGWVAVVVILLGSAALRLVWLDRYPPGWHHDEALMGVMAGEVYRGDERPVFFRQYLGQEPLYIYASAAAMALLGGNEDILPLRLTSAAFGLGTVLLTYGVGRALFGRRIGLLAMALVGASFWQVMSSRNAYRSITQPLLEALTVWLFWRAWTRRSLLGYALAGAALGATLYTYLGARAFPVVFLGFAAWLVVTRGWPTRAALVRGATFGATALLVVAPLAAFFLANPGTFSARMEQVFIFRSGVSGGHPWRLLADNTLKLLASFTFSGEPMWRYNIPGRPMFVGALALAFYVGLVVVLGRVWRRDDASALVLIWLAAMFFPSLLSWDVGAYTLRAMGLVPAVYLVPALGLDWAWQRLAMLPAGGPRLATAVVGVLLVVETGWTARDYFVVWAPSFGAAWEGHADAVAQARFLAQAARPAAEDLFVGNEYYHHPTLAQLARPVYPSLRWFDGRQDVVFSPWTHRPALYVFGFSGLPADPSELFPAATKVGEAWFPRGIDGGAPPPLFQAYRLTADQVAATVERLTDDPRLRPVAGRIADAVVPVGARIDGPVRPGEEVKATLIWKVGKTLPPGDYQLVVQLLDERWGVVSSVEGLGLPPPEWRPGDVVWSRFRLPVPEGTTPGRYRVQLGLYDTHTRERLPVSDGLPGIDALILGDVRVVGTEPVPPPALKLGTRFGPSVQLVGIDPPRLVDRTTVAVTLDWRADRPLDRDYTVFVQLLSSEGKLVAQSDGYPAGGALPTSSWLPGEIIRDEHRLTLRPDLPPGTYHLIAGLYLLSTGQRLPVAGGGDFVELASLLLPSSP